MLLQAHTKFTAILLASIALCIPTCTFAESGSGVEKTYVKNSLCDESDIVFFSCVAKSNKTISLCGKGDKSSPIAAYYRYGKANKVEMDFPEIKDEKSFSLFSYEYYFRYKVNRWDIYFDNGNYTYVIYDYYEDDDPDAEKKISNGVIVNDNSTNKTIADIKCKSDVISDFPSLIEKIKCKGDYCKNN